MANVSLHIKEHYNYHNRKTMDNTVYADMIGGHKQNVPISSSPPSFTCALFSCCGNDWDPRNKRREVQSPLFTPTTIPPQNIIMAPKPLEWSI